MNVKARLPWTTENKPDVTGYRALILAIYWRAITDLQSRRQIDRLRAAVFLPDDGLDVAGIRERIEGQVFSHPANRTLEGWDVE